MALSRKQLKALKFDPNVDASDRPIKNVTQPGRAVQIIGGFGPSSPPPAQPLVVDAETAAKYTKLLGVTPDQFAVFLESVRARNGGPVTPAQLKSLVEFDTGTEGLKFIDQARDAMKYDEYENAAKFAEQAIAVFRSLVEAGLAVESLQHLANALSERGKALSRLRRHTEAIVCFDEALAIEKKLRDEHGDVVFSLAHADTFLDKGVVLMNAGRHGEAAECYQIAMTVYRRGFGNGDRTAGSRVALTLLNLAESKRIPGHFQEAVAHYDESLEVHRRLSTEKSADAAAVLIGKSRALYAIGDFESALLAAQAATESLEPMVARDDSLKIPLSAAVLCRGRALERLYRLKAASECFQRSTELVRDLKRKRGTYQEPVEP